jgi:predicted LPLAT superfamily acyltransferase
VKQAWIERPEGGSELGFRLLALFATGFGRTAARLVLMPITLYYLIRRGPERRASRAYLERITGKRASLWAIARHIHTFAAVILDRLFLLSERFKRFDIRVHGLDDLRKVWGQQRGVLIFGSHLGSFDALRVLAQFRSDVRVRVVLDMDQSPQLMRILNRFNPELARSVINARQDGTNTVLAIKEALDEKSLVTLLIDRARPGNEVSEVRFLGSPAPLPTGPWQIAAALKVPIVLCFGLYRGGNRYDLHFEPFADVVALPRASRQQSLDAVIQRYAERLEHYARMAPYNWFNFYDFWHPPAPPDAARDRVAPDLDSDEPRRRA